MLAIRGGGYRFPGQATAALQGVDLAVQPGERLLLAGASGSGKSTLLRLASGLLGEHGRGEVLGEVRLDGQDPGLFSGAARAQRLGWVGQDPGAQILAGTVADEVAFSLESQALAPEQIAERVREVLELVGLSGAEERDPWTLSGGQQQRVVVGAALAAGGSVLLLDEPLARLDPAGASALLDVLARLAQGGIAVVLAEHRLEFCMPWADRVCCLEEGAVAWTGPASEASAAASIGALIPSARRQTLPELGAELLRRGGIEVRYGEHIAVQGVDLRLRAGERLAVVGPNGAGKSSLLGAIAGRLGPTQPELRALEVPQDPDLSLFSDTVRDELAYGPIEQGLGEADCAALVTPIAEALGLVELLDRAPQALSSGERLRVAVGAAIACRPEVLLLDEPTAGQDAGAVDRLLELLDALLPQAAVVFATHDLGLADRQAHRILHLDRGRTSEDARPGAMEAVHAGRRRPWALDPRARLALLAAVGTLAVVLDRPLTLLALASLSGLVLFSLPIGWAWRRRALVLAAALVWTTVISQGLFYGDVPRTPVLSMGPLTLWQEGLWHGLAQSLRLLAAAFAGVALAVSTPTDWLVAGLGALRMPWSVGLLGAVALRAAPTVASEWVEVRRARAARGGALLRRSPWAWWLLEAKLLRPVAARALRRARALALSLDARGFSTEGRRSLRVPLRLRAHDLLLTGSAWAVVGSVVVLELLYRAYLAEALYLPALRPVYGLVRSWL